MTKPEPIVTQLIDKRITEAKCSACGEALEIPDRVGSRQEQELVLEIAFGKHLRMKHSPGAREDVNQAAARIVREATDRA
jgi:hypothetical protein